MKIIAYYLPQFHEIPENDEWWGTGFTEWVNVRKAKPLFKGHRQPRIPLNDNYYDLMNKKTVEWQTSLLDKYNIYGLCYYHYWFNGKLLLEKPAENLMKWTDINQRYCFAWANSTWKRTWTGGKDILIEQTYGGKEEWDNHMHYLLPFFRDSRYIKIEGKPVFMILEMPSIPNVVERLEYYNELCKKAGFPGIYFIQSVCSHQFSLCRKACAITLREPANTHYSFNTIYDRVLRHFKKDKKFNLFRKPLTYQWDRVAKASIHYDYDVSAEVPIHLGAFKEWDSTSRHGKHGYIITKPTPEQFANYLRELKKITSQRQGISDIVFFTAWNEWCEDCYLEPDSDDSYNYLQAISEVV